MCGVVAGFSWAVAGFTDLLHGLRIELNCSSSPCGILFVVRIQPLFLCSIISSGCLYTLQVLDRVFKSVARVCESGVALLVTHGLTHA